MKDQWVDRALLMPATAWFLVMLVLPLVVVAVFSFGERGAAGGYVPAFTFDQYANLPARFTAFKNTMKAHSLASGSMMQVGGSLGSGM